MSQFIYTQHVRYPDTDKMGTMHHSRYATYYETARWEYFRSIGLPYKTIEDMGYLFPVIEMNTKFIKTTEYDELLHICITITSIRASIIEFSNTIINANNERINECTIQIACVKKDTWKPCRIPQPILDALHKTL